MDLSWMKYLPPFLRRKLEGRHDLKLIIDNSGWLLFDKALRMLGGVLIGVLIARHLGPHEFGQLNYAAALVALFGTFATLGLEGIVVRDLVKFPDLNQSILGSALFLKFIGGIVALVTAILTIIIIRPTDYMSHMIVAIMSLSLVFQSFEAIEFLYKSKVQSKFPTLAKLVVFLAVILLRIALLSKGAPLISFVWANAIETLLGSIFLIILYQHQHLGIQRWKIDNHIIKKLLGDSWPLILSGLAIMIYMRIDQIMLGGMIGDNEVGNYSAALRLSETWYFFPLIIVSSVGPTLIKSRQASEELYYQRLQKLFDYMTLMSISLAIAISLGSNFLIKTLYGNQYSGAGVILAIHIWSSVFYFLGVAGSQWYLIENMQKYAFYRTLYGAALNILLNFYLIPNYGGIGAAIATLISQCSASYLFNLMNPKTVIIFKMQTKALLRVITFQTPIGIMGIRKSDD